METIRKATENDIQSVVNIYENVIDHDINVKKTVGWKHGIYPTEDTARTGLAADDLYVMEDGGRIVATARINQEQLEEYRSADWEHEVPDDKVLVLHTLAVDPSAAGRVYGTRFVAFYERLAGESGCTELRMDTNRINTPARTLYAKLGYREVGEIPCSFNGISDVRLLCLEKFIGE